MKEALQTPSDAIGRRFAALVVKMIGCESGKLILHHQHGVL